MRSDKIIATIQDVVYTTRRTGNTTWILKSAIKNSNCIIVGSDKRYANDLKREYYRLLSKEPFYKKIIWKFIGRKNPTFKSIGDDFRSYNLPIIFDNSVFI